MKIFKYIFLLFLIAIIGGSIYIATLDGDYQIEESKIIDAPPSLLFKEVNNYKNWEVWGPWRKEDPNMVVTYNQKTTGVGAGYSWQGDTAEDGNIITTDVIPNKEIHQEVTIKNPLSESKSNIYWNFEPIENGKTKLVWGVKADKSFWDKAYSLTQKEKPTEIWKPYLNKGLTSIDTIVTNKMKAYDINVDGITQHSGGFYMYTTTASKNNSKMLSAKMGEMLPSVLQFMESNNIAVSGSPMTVYKEVDEQNNTVIISSGIPTNSKVVTPLDSNILCGFMDSQQVLKTTLKGNYNNLAQTWMVAEDYIKNHNIEKTPNAEPFEIYITDPEKYPNPADWVTELYIPVQQQNEASFTDKITRQNSNLEH